ncbi:acid-activated periplasmic chaperone HdeA [Serratia fonticola]|uniref:acid-activated periplasmic chaperone HdeA n=1 Tax=Serratia fonticola TaxID=47917 RepID=UPI002DBABF80|nr:acid-activated periplasmic chaperone HdeA [Serratia fonticola]MEB7883203.1 acid-activated periplasmic chaperone HdeA [Serratia fonticola]
MKKQILALGMTCFLTYSTVALADESKKPVSTWTCEDFLALDESYQPTAIGFAEALNKKGNPEDSVLDIDGIEKVTPMLVESCKKDPQSKFLTELKSAWKSLKKDM